MHSFRNLSFNEIELLPQLEILIPLHRLATAGMFVCELGDSNFIKESWPEFLYTFYDNGTFAFTLAGITSRKSNQSVHENA